MRRKSFRIYALQINDISTEQGVNRLYMIGFGYDNGKRCVEREEIVRQ